MNPIHSEPGGSRKQTTNYFNQAEKPSGISLFADSIGVGWGRGAAGGKTPSDHPILAKM